jgi:hypothetical protein
VRMPRYFFHVKRGQVTLLDQNGTELGGHEEAEAEGKRRLQEILTESDPKGGMANRGAVIIAEEGARCSNCRSRMARAIGTRPRPVVRLGLVDPADFSRDKNSSPPIGWCRWHVRHMPKKNGRRSGGEGRPNISRADQPYNDRGGRRLENKSAVGPWALAPPYATASCVRLGVVLFAPFDRPKA